ncbi:MAG TPA: hypothetical protein DDW52_13435 [Planctomycetaceae bacterium]|nr:hypothetical protein [Planctomycetaceae bacterium]
MLENEIRDIASRMRHAWERIKQLDESYKDFPANYCSAASNCMAAYFHDLGCRVEYKKGHCPVREDGVHDWLLVDGYVVDITADQYRDLVDTAVIVAEHSTWHASLRPEEVPICNIETRAAEIKSRAYPELYRKLLSYL